MFFVVEYAFNYGTEEEETDDNILSQVFGTITGVFVVDIPDAPFLVTLFMSMVNTFLITITSFIVIASIRDWVPFI